MNGIKPNKYIFGAIVILILVGVILGYHLVHRESKKIPDPIEKKGSKNDSAKHFNRGLIPTAMGAKPKTYSKDASVKIVEDFIKQHSKNPETFEFLEWSELSTEGAYWKVRCKYKGITSFNAEVTTNAWFYIQNNKVVYTKIISKI